MRESWQKEKQEKITYPKFCQRLKFPSCCSSFWSCWSCWSWFSSRSSSLLLECAEVDLEFSQALWRLSLAASFKTSAVCKSSPEVLIKIWQQNKQRQLRQLEKHLESVVLFMTVVTCYDSEQLQNLIESTEPPFGNRICQGYLLQCHEERWTWSSKPMI